MKQCCKCKKVKGLSEFYPNKATKDNYTVYCKKCVKAKDKIHRLKQKVKFRGLYSKWQIMKQRCSNPKAMGYKYYGGRGIIICQEWKDSFLTFYNWAIANGHKKGLEIDRRDNNGNYCPENCRFVTHTENIRNSSSTKLNIEKVKVIKKLLKEGKLMHKNIGKMFNVGDAVISQINIGIIWMRC